ncbi:carcinine hydrolase/isopenicillin-N N-acyltransferase family protein [Nonomuraea sp. SBT364]|uniref:carcinine hydrolase/isopenicillin-N N-acyltransferase family protein n=1 Tax=Nonomuraea sp. SBT364 TaxID=1580530 RepID=UPI00066C751E|nr:carcinine hydrolase/isopenicillin-N N-acyltransferase family protein [Nonomuraea sp. SBT364]
MRRRTARLLPALLVCVLTACAAPPPPRAAPRPATGAVLRQSAAEAARTAAGLRQLDDLPLYEMTFHGGYDAEAPLTEQELARRDDAWACSLFLRPAAGSGASGPVFGRNFDWDPHPAMVVHARPPGGYASLSVSDVSYVLGHAGAPDLKDPADRRRLAHAVLAPFDGMNEKGLAVGLAQVPDALLPGRTPGRTPVGSARIIRLVLDRAATVGEAVALMRRYDVDFSGGPQVHYLIGDRTGRSVVVEYGDGRLNVVGDRVLTNITMTGTSRATRLADPRYRALSEGVGTAADPLALLRRVAQPHTRWSIVYDLTAGTARLVTGQRWSRVHDLAISSPG